MAAPIPGDVEYAYNRVYIVVNPNPAAGPPTYRVSSFDELPGPGNGGGSGTSTIYDFDSDSPIVVDQTPGTGDNPTRVVTSMDIAQLDDRDV